MSLNFYCEQYSGAERDGMGRLGDILRPLTLEKRLIPLCFGYPIFTLEIWDSGKLSDVVLKLAQYLSWLFTDDVYANICVQEIFH